MDRRVVSAHVADNIADLRQEAIVALVASQLIKADSAKQGIIPVAAKDRIVAHSSIDRVIREAANQKIVADTAINSRRPADRLTRDRKNHRVVSSQSRHLDLADALRDN